MPPLPSPPMLEKDALRHTRFRATRQPFVGARPPVCPRIHARSRDPHWHRIQTLETLLLKVDATRRRDRDGPDVWGTGTGTAWVLDGEVASACATRVRDVAA